MPESAPEQTPEPGPPPAAVRSTAAAAVVAAGILLSRIVGLVRERVLATYFGTGLHADVFSAGLRLPNVLQNLLGEGTLSASFIPAYSALLGQGRNARVATDSPHEGSEGAAELGAGSVRAAAPSSLF